MRTISQIAQAIHTENQNTRAFTDSQEAFHAAIKCGRLSSNPAADNYAGDFMYMGHANGKAQFKNINTRAYIA